MLHLFSYIIFFVLCYINYIVDVAVHDLQLSIMGCFLVCINNNVLFFTAIAWYKQAVFVSRNKTNTTKSNIRTSYF